MNHIRSSLVLACLSAGLFAQDTSSTPPSKPKGVCRAVLVGVTEYPELKKTYEAKGKLAQYESRIRLQGPRNDVQRMKATLASALGAAEANIKTLTADGDAASQPTRKNIITALEDLARQAKRDDLAVIFLAGHGAQVPDTSGDEVDGFDEVFLPSDTSVWDDKTKTVQGALLDDEIAPLLGKIQGAGARVWFVVDSCHAGTMMRGGEQEDFTRSLTTTDLEIPGDAAAETKRVPTNLDELDKIGPGVTAFYAVHPTQSAVETYLPAGAKDRHGVFTWFLTEQVARSGPGTTFSELHQRICNSLFQCGRGHLTPVLEGEGSVTLMDGSATGARLQLRNDQGRLVLDGGSIHGIKEGDVLDVYPTEKRGQKGASLGQVTVVSARLTESEVQPSKGRALPKDKIPTGAQMLAAEISDASMETRKVRLLLIDDDGKPAPISSLPSNPLTDKDAALRATWVNDKASADYLARRKGDTWHFTTPRTSGVALTATDDTFATVVHRMFRARGLRMVADSSLGRMPANVSLKVEVRDEKGTSLGELKGGMAVRPGWKVHMELSNHSSQRVEVRGYCLDSELVLGKLYDFQEVAPGKDFTKTLDFNDTTQGQEQLLTIISPPGAMHLDALTQELQQVRTRGQESQPRGILGELVSTEVALRGLNDSPEEVGCVHALCYTIGWGEQIAKAKTDEKLASYSELVRSRLQRRAYTEWSPASSLDKSRSLSDVYEKVAPAVVAVHSGNGHGTGFLIDAAQGLVLTNDHVIASSSLYSKRTGRPVYRLVFGDLDADGFMRITHADVIAEVIHKDRGRDLALLRILDRPEWLGKRAVVKVEPRAAKPATSCAIVGHPSSGMLWSVRSGLVSATGSWPKDHISNIMQLVGLSADERTAATEALDRESPRKVLISTCGANPGDSGSPLVDEQGNLIAVTFAVPSNPMDKEFTYHVALDEVLAFMKAAPGPNYEPALVPPQAWFEPAALGWTPSSEGNNQAWMKIEHGPDNSLFIDFDGDSTLEAATAEEAIAAMQRGQEKELDFEIAITQRPQHFMCSYDCNDDGKFDLILVDHDGDRKSDFEYRFDEESGKWAFETASGRPVVFLKHLGGQYGSSKSKAYKQATWLLQQLLD